MINIMFLILKIIGIILAIVIGILLLVVLVVLFMPFTYRVNGEIHNDVDTFHGIGKGRWLFGILRFGFEVTASSFVWNGHILWIDLNKDEIEDDNIDDEEYDIDEEDDRDYTTDHVSNLSVKTQREEIESEFLADEKQFMAKEEAELAAIEEAFESHTEKKSPCKEKKHPLDTIKKKIKNISNTISKFCDTIKLLIQKKDKLLAFYYMDVHQYAIGRIKAQLLYLLKKLKPKKLQINGEFGFEDPSVTGQCIGGISVLYPIYAGMIHVKPNFYEKVYDFDFALKGKLRLYPFVIVSLRLLLDKKMRQTYKNIRRFEF